PARIAIGSRIDAKHRAQLDVERSLLPRLTHRGVLDGFSDVNEAARYRPSKWKILAFDQDDAVADFGDHVGGDQRAYWTRHHAILPRAIARSIASVERNRARRSRGPKGGV